MVSKLLINNHAVEAYCALKMGKRGGWNDPASIGLEQDGVIVAGFVYDSYNGASCAMHVAADKLERWFVRIAFDYPFNQLRLKMVYGPVSSANRQACRLAERLGGNLLCSIPEGHPDGDLNLYVMRRDNCRWIGKRDDRFGEVQKVA